MSFSNTLTSGEHKDKAFATLTNSAFKAYSTYLIEQSLPIHEYVAALQELLLHYQKHMTELAGVAIFAAQYLGKLPEGHKQRLSAAEVENRTQTITDKMNGLFNLTLRPWPTLTIRRDTTTPTCCGTWHRRSNRARRTAARRAALLGTTSGRCRVSNGSSAPGCGCRPIRTCRPCSSATSCATAPNSGRLFAALPMANDHHPHNPAGLRDFLHVGPASPAASLDLFVVSA